MKNKLLTMAIILGLLLLPAGAWGEDINVFGTLTSNTGYECYVLTDGNKYTLSNDITLEGPLYVGPGITVTIDLNGHTINRGLSSATTNGNVMKVASGGNLTIKDTSTGGTITGGFNSGNGGGIINEGTLTFEGGNITSNKSTGNGAGIYHNGTSLTMKGAPTITNNTKSNGENNVYLVADKKIAIGAGGLTTGASIGVTLQSAKGTFTTGATSAVNTYFSSDDARLQVVADGNDAKLQTPWDALQTLLDGGSTVTLTQTYNAISGLDGPLVVNNSVTLDLATFNINRNLTSAATNGYVIRVESGKTLTIQGTTGQIKGGYNNGNGGGIYNDGTVDLQGGIITCNKVTTNYNGAGIYNAGTLKMQGAPQVTSNTINNTTTNNVYLPSTKLIDVSTALTDGASIGVTLQSVKGTFTTGAASAVNTYFSSDDTRLQVANDGNDAKLITEWDFLQSQLDAGEYTLTKNYTAITDIDGPLTITGTKTLNLGSFTINRNLTSATEDGYVIKVNSGATLTITGSGTIKGGYNTENGGGIYNAGTLNLNGGNITQNYVSTEKKGAGVYNEGTLTMAGSASVTNNKVNGSSGTLNNIYLTTSQKMDITASLTGISGITHADGHAVFTTNLSGRGTATNFSADINGYGIGLDASGNAIVGQSYTINSTRDQDSGVSTPAPTVKTSAVEGECVSVTLPNGLTPRILTYTYNNETHPETKYYKNGGTVTFTMPAYNVSVYARYTTAGGYCGNSSDDGGRNVKWIIDNGSLIFTAEDGSRQMNTYASANTIPWRGYNYTSFSFPSNVTNITPYAFYGSGLTSASIHKDVTSIGEDAFGKCTSLTSITVDGANENYSSSDDILYNKDKTTLICYPAGKTGNSHTVDASVTGIAIHAFAYNPFLNAVSIPTATASIGTGAFNGCTGLTTITVDGGNTSYSTNEGILYDKTGTTLICYPAGKNATSFSGFPNTVTAIGDYAFFMQSYLESVTIPTTVTSIGNSAFQNCSALSLVYALRTGGVPTGGISMFDGNANPRKIMVKDGQGNAYKGATYWSNYENQIYEMNLANATVALSYYTVPSDGSVHEPTVTVTFGGITLIKDQDYTVTYSGDRKSVGEVTVTVTGINNYAGTSNNSATYNITRTITFTNVTGNYATYYANENLAIPSGFTAYTFAAESIDWDNGTLTPTQVNYIKALTPVLLYKSGGVNGTYHVNAGSGTDYTAHSDFKGVLTSTPYSTVKGSGSAVYVLKNDKFLRVSNTDDNLATQSLPANRCYLLRPSEKTSPNFAPSYLSIIIGNSEVTKIEISPENGENVDGRVWYTLDGRRLQGKPTQKGIYISNGKKIHIK